MTKVTEVRVVQTRRPRHEILVDYVLACYEDSVLTPVDLVTGGFDRVLRAVRADGAAALAELGRRGAVGAVGTVAAVGERAGEVAGRAVGLGLMELARRLGR